MRVSVVASPGPATVSRRLPVAAMAACLIALVTSTGVGAHAGTARLAHAEATRAGAPHEAQSSAHAPPHVVTRAVGGREVARVSAVQQDARGARVVTERVRGRAEATAAVRDLQADPATTSVAIADPVRIATSDSEYEQQWAFPRLRLPEAWRATTGAGVTVAVVDTGVDAEHPDLAANLVPGINVVGSSRSDDVADGHGHGTHVAGIVAAVTDNAVGVAGVAPSARIMPVKALDDHGSGWSSDVAEGIVHAAEHGAGVINLSLSSSSDNAVLEDAVSYARSQGVVVVAAAGNGRQRGNPVAYPAAFAGVIAVAATDVADIDADFSNTGDYVDLAAPGVAIRSTVPGGGYGDLSGTSMAAPHVAGVIALLLQELADKGSVNSDDAVFDLLTRTAEDLGEPGWDPAYGYGLVDPVAAVTAVTAGLPPVRPGPPPRLPAAPAVPADAPVATPTPTPTVTPEPVPGASPTPTVAPAPTATPDLRPGAPRELRVRLGRPPVTLRWRPPRSGPVAGYFVRTGRVVDGSVSWRKWRPATGTRAKAAVSLGRWRVQVVAVGPANGQTATRDLALGGTAVGGPAVRGPAATRTFSVTRALLHLARG